MPILRHDGDGSAAKSSFAKSTTLNNHFYKCFNKKQPTLSDPYFDVAYASLHPSGCPSNFLSTEESVMESRMNCDITKSTDPDGISPNKLNYTSVYIALSTSKLFNVSISAGVFPAVWKLGRIVPKGTNSF